MTSTITEQREGDTPARHGLSSLQKGLIGAVVLFFARIPVFWYLEHHVGVSHDVASSAMSLLSVTAFTTALVLPWLPLRDQRGRTRSERLSVMVIVWVCICLAPRFIWELPWLFFLDEIREGVQNGSL